ncbi:MAG: benzoate transporter, partial [Sarcina sp.]
MSKTPLKKVIKGKLKSNKELTEAEKVREQMKYEIAAELGLEDKVNSFG